MTPAKHTPPRRWWPTPQSVVIAAEGSKIGIVTFARMAGLADIHDLVTDITAPPPPPPTRCRRIPRLRTHHTQFDPTFFVWAQKSKINTAVLIDHRQAKTTRALTQEQRLAWLKELLTGDAQSLPYRVAGTMLLLYAQPLTRIAVLKTTAMVLSPREMRISLGAEPVPALAPFAGVLSHHPRNRPNLRTGGGMVANRWLFPGCHPGTHLDPQSIMQRLRRVGGNLLGGRN